MEDDRFSKRVAWVAGQFVELCYICKKPNLLMLYPEQRSLILFYGNNKAFLQDSRLLHRLFVSFFLLVLYVQE